MKMHLELNKDDVKTAFKDYIQAALELDIVILDSNITIKYDGENVELFTLFDTITVTHDKM